MASLLPPTPGVPTETPPYDLFISFAEADRAWVEGYLLDALDQAGVRHVSEAAFELGAPRVSEFERAIRQSRRTLLVLSSAYFASEFGQFADLLAQSYGGETGTWPVIPLLREHVELPTRLAMLVALDATDPNTQRAAIDRLCLTLQHPLPDQQTMPDCPYLGMVPFGERDAQQFFGRDAEIAELVDRLRLSPFMAVIGASGSGKSSLVFAGLIPALRRSKLFGPGSWCVCQMRPGETPLATLTTILGADPADPHMALTTALSREPNASRLLLIVDQLEELFTVTRESAAEFQQAIQRLAAADRCYVVLTVRADFYADLMASPLWPLISAHRLEITPLNEQGLRDAIVQPAESAGVFVDPALVERIVADAAGEPGILPLIQETLVLLWEKLERRFLPLRAYESLVAPRPPSDSSGVKRTGLQVAMARRADAAFAALPPDRQPIVRRIFLRLVQFGEGRADTRRQQPVTALRSAHDDTSSFDATLNHLTSSRLLTLGGGEHDPDRNVDIAHEALIGGWPLLAGWIAERRGVEQVRRRLEAKTAEWIRLGRSAGGLLDTVELAEAERWIAGADAVELGYDADLPQLIDHSRAFLALQRAAAQRRTRWTIAGLAFGLALALALAGWAYGERNRATRQASIALSRQIADQSQNQLVSQLDRALLLGAQAFRTSPTLQARRSLGTAVHRGPHLQRFLHGLHSRILAVSWSADQRQALAIADNGTLLRWDSATGDSIGQPVNIAPRSGSLVAAFAPDRTRFVTFGCYTATLAAPRCSEDALQFWDVASTQPIDQPIALPSSDATVGANLAWSPDGQRVAVSWYTDYESVSFAVVELATRKRTMLEDVSTSVPLDNFAWSPDGRTIAVNRPDRNRVDLLDSATLTTRASIDAVFSPETHEPIVSVGRLAFNPSSGWLAVGLTDGTLQYVEPDATQRIDRQNLLPLGVANTINFVADGSVAVVGTDDGKIVWYDPVFDGMDAEPFAGHPASVTALQIGPDGRTLLSGDLAGNLLIWSFPGDVAPGEQRALVETGDQRYGQVAYAPDSGALTAVTWDDSYYYIDNPPEGTHVLARLDRAGAARTTPGHSNILALSDDGARLAVSQPDGTIVLTDTATEQHAGVLTGFPDRAQILAWSPDRSLLAALSCVDHMACPTATLRVWNVADGTARQATIDMNGAMPQPSPAQDGRLLTKWAALAIDRGNHQIALATNERLLRIDLGTLKQRGAPLLIRAGEITGLVFSPDGTLIAISGAMFTDAPNPATYAQVSVLDAATGQVLGAPLSGSAFDTVVAWSRDGTMLATGAYSGAIKLWDVASRQLITQITPVGDFIAAYNVVALSFSPDDRTLASIDSDGRIVEWSVDPAAWVQRACRLANRNLTADEWNQLIGPETPYQPTCPDLPSAPQATSTGAP